MTLYGDLTEVYGDLFGLHDELGDPRCRGLCFCAYTPGISYPTTISRITPNPIITTPPKRLIGLETSVGRQHIISEQDDYVKLPRTFQRELFKRKCYVDAEFSTNGLLISGFPAVVVYVGDKNPLNWELVLKRNKDREGLELDNG